uniref:Uncharacterized protein n=1 Tax=Anguilla anguilla TaxID=7936 RepID=A0A0E9Q7D3_ANGAN
MNSKILTTSLYLLRVLKV